MVILNQERAFQGFFAKRAKIPQFKCRDAKQSFSLPQGFSVDWKGGKIRLPKLLDGVKAELHRSFEGKVKTGTVTKTATGRYFISLLVEEAGEETPVSAPNSDTCLGIDLGLKDFLIGSDGLKVAPPKYLSKKLKKLNREQRKLARKKKSSLRREKQRKCVARQHEKVANSRRDFHHKLSRRLVENQNHASFAVETLGVKDLMVKSKKDLTRDMADAGWFQFRTFLVYKANRAGKAVLAIDRYAPSSKSCICGHVNHDLKLSDRNWTCPECGRIHDRDINAAQNIKRFALANPIYLGREPSEVTHGESDPLQSNDCKVARRTVKNSLTRSESFVA